MKKLSVVIAVLLLICSCATRVIPKNSDYFQSMGRSGQIVLTAKSELTDNYRVSLQINDDYTVDGIIQLYGIPDSIIRSVLKSKSDSLPFDYILLGNSTVLFSDGNVKKAFNDLIRDYVKIIDDETAMMMKEKPYSVFLSNCSVISYWTSRFNDFDFSDFRQMVFLSDDLKLFDGVFSLTSPSKAETFLSLMKAEYIKELRKSGNRILLSDIENGFSLSDNTVTLKNILEYDFSDYGLKDLFRTSVNIF